MKALHETNFVYESTDCSDNDNRNNYKSKQFKIQEKEMNQCINDMFYQSETGYEQNKKALPMKYLASQKVLHDINKKQEELEDE